MISLGVTGTQHGLSVKQTFAAMYIFSQLQDSVNFAHFGDCIGVDAEIYHLVKQFAPECKTVGHIPDKNDKRAFCKYDIERKPKPYLDRDKDIVSESDLMLVFPYEEKEKLRSGTWATYRYAKQTKTPIIIVYPNGKFKKL